MRYLKILRAFSQLGYDKDYDGSTHMNKAQETQA